ncbi:MAG TPA: hypothetical protein VM598_08640 [Bdellovibrionota bacterium]|nr:hypothetical protein [Bdellovibrionota bacterium]
MALWIDEIDALIKQGDSAQAKRKLRPVNRNEIDRKDLARACGVATRAGLPELAIRWLNPIVRAERKLLHPATEREKAEYAIALIRIGAQPEALGILKDLSARENPQVLLFRAVGHFSQWDYLSALPVLEEYLTHPVTEYQRLVGLVNLSAALIFESLYDRAEEVLSRALAAAREAKATLLLGNCLELSAQLALAQGSLKEADEHLKNASAEFAESGSIDSFFVRKWRAVLDLKRSATSERIARLGAIRAEGLELRHWESVRDCDFYLASHTRDSSLVAHLYHGTPFARFRQRIREEIGPGLEIPPSFDWQLGSGRAGGPLIDLELGEEVSSGRRLKPDQIPHRLLKALAHDFYRPYTVAGLFGRMFPNDYFHPVYSVGRVHQALVRLRQWLASARIDLLIDESHGHYRLGARKPVRIRTTLASQREQPLEAPLRKLRSEFASRPFSSREASRCLAMPLRSAIRCLVGAVDSGSLSKQGAGRKVRYRFPGA